MAANRQRLSVTEFDFDEVKDNLKLFMRNQTEFKDYDFEGSGLSALLDVLAYNTHYLGFNANMLANEKEKVKEEKEDERETKKNIINETKLE